ncbi:MAG: hypothetical protein MJE68_11520 [Proteobacteria bacterium]|nr:hypothetical protein [Pseudomonadota bacterium]
MPPKRQTAQEVKSIIKTIEQEKSTEIKNAKLDIRYKKLEDLRIKLEAFERTLDQKKSE